MCFCLVFVSPWVENKLRVLLAKFKVQTYYSFDILDLFLLGKSSGIAAIVAESLVPLLLGGREWLSVLGRNE
jgi:hypothetical protein